jgi:copper chaperone CopZ
VKKALKEMPGVQNATVDLGKGTVVVTAANGQMPSEANLAQVVQDSGFTLVKVEGS